MVPPQNRLWLAPAALAPVSGAVQIPGSKSVSNRALLLAAIADGPSTLRGVLRARDTQLMTAALAALGAQIRSNGMSTLVQPAPFVGDVDIDCGLAGNVMRFVPAIAGLAVGRVGFHGDPRASERPLGPLLTALRHLGVPVDPDARTLPFGIDATGTVRGGPVRIDSSASSQFLSALLMAGARYDDGIDVTHLGGPIPSRPHIDMTIQMLQARGVAVDQPADDRWIVASGTVKALDQTIEPDLSNAAAFLAAAAVTGGQVSVAPWPERTQQPGDHFLEILQRFGARVVRDGDTVAVSGTGRIDGIDIDLHDHGELTPVVAAVAALAGSPTRIRGVAHLRGHESDRLAALAQELGRLASTVVETEDGLEITSPATTAAGPFRTYHDHRMAHAAAILGLRVSPLYVDGIATTAKTFPGFAAAWTALVSPAR